jgi:hypothetical protein
MAGTVGEDALKSLLADNDVHNLFVHLEALPEPCTKLVHLWTLKHEDFAKLREMDGVASRDVTVLEQAVEAIRPRKARAVGGAAACVSPIARVGPPAVARRVATAFPDNKKPAGLDDAPVQQVWLKKDAKFIADAIMEPGLGLERLVNAQSLKVGPAHETSGTNGHFKSMTWAPWCVVHGFPRIQGNSKLIGQVLKLLADKVKNTTYTQHISDVTPTKKQMRLVWLHLDWHVHETRKKAMAKKVHRSVCGCGCVLWSTSRC